MEHCTGYTRYPAGPQITMHAPIATVGRLPVLLLLSSVLALRLAAQTGTDANRLDHLSEEVAKAMRELGVPGVAFGILHEGRIQARALGITSIENPLPVTTDTLFQTGSISKTYTGTLVMSLVESGLIDLDAPVRRYLPQFRVADDEASGKATMRTLLTHMGGWEGDFFDDTGNGDDALERMVTSLATLPQIAPVHRFWSYNNAGFYVAGRVVEVVTGETFEQALNKRLFVPMGLKQTHVFPADVMTRRFAVGHAGAIGRMTVLEPWALPRAAHGVGGVVADIHDLLRYGQFHLGDGMAPDGSVRILSEQTLRRMHTTQVTKQGTPDAMAITWHVSEAGGVRQLSHGGSTNGQQASLTLVPEQGFAIAFLTNSNRGGRLARQATRHALQTWFHILIEDPGAVDDLGVDLKAHVGRYERSFADVVITSEGDRLLIQVIRKQGFPSARAAIPAPEPPAPARFCAPDRVVFVGGTSRGATAEFLTTPEGAIGWVRVGGRLYRRVDPGASDC